MATPEEVTEKNLSTPTKVHHIDRRAHAIAAIELHPELRLSTKDLATILGYSVQWLEIGRSKAKSGGYGPPFEKLTARSVRYRWADVCEWLKECSRTCDRQREVA